LVGLGILFVLWRIWHFFKDLSVEKERKARMKAWKEAKFSAARSQQQFMHMDPFEFEHYIGWLYTMYGYEVEVTQSRGDKGIDAHASRDGKEYAIQVKQYKQGNTVGRPELQQFMGSMIGYDGGIFITTSNFTTGAIEYAKDHPDLELIDGAKLLHMAQNL
jgi:restriction endonuclease Mrr